MTVIRAVYGLPAKYERYMGLEWPERRNSTHTLAITRQLWVVFLQSGSCIGVLSVRIPDTEVHILQLLEICHK